MGINSATMKFRDDLVKLVNESGLPMCNIEMVMSNVLSAVRVSLASAIESENKAEEKEAVKNEQSV